MLLRVYNTALELVKIVEEFESLIWNRKYYECGTFELVLPLTDENIIYLKKDYIIYKSDGEAGIIISRNIEIKSDGSEVLKITGESLSGILKKRILINKIEMNDTYSNIIRKIVLFNFIAPVNSNRKISNLEFGEISIDSEKTYYESEEHSIAYDEINKLVTSSEIGFNIKLDIKNKKFIFNLYKGIDRSSTQKERPPVKFSRDLENILSLDYTDTNSNYKNVAIVFGDGEGSSRKKTIVNDNLTGIERIELYVDANDIKSTETRIVEVEVEDEDEEGNVTGSHTVEKEMEVSIPWSEYEPLLIKRGNEKLYECKDCENFEGDVNTHGNNIYKVDYDLGDIVTVSDKKINRIIHTRIIEIQEVYEKGKDGDITLTFNNKVPSILDYIKKMR